MLEKRIAELRKDKQISQEQLADILNTSRQAVSKWERGESLPDIDKLKDLATYFDVSIDYLLGYDIKSISVNKFIERIDKCVEESSFDISIDDVKLMITKNPNNYDLLVKVISYIGGYLIFNRDKEVKKLLIEYCERGIAIYQKDNIAKVTISDLQKGIINIYISQEKYELAKEYIKNNNVQDADIYMAKCELNLGNYDAAKKIASEAFLKDVTNILNVNSTQIETLLRINNVKDAYDLAKWCIALINSISKKDELFSNVIFGYTYISAVCEKNLGLDYSESLNHLKEFKGNINSVDVNSTGAIKYYYSDKTPIYSSFSGFDDALELVKPLNKKLKEDALFIYNEAKGETNE